MDNRTNLERTLDGVLGLIDNLPSVTDGEQEQQNLPRSTIDPVEIEPVASALAITPDMTPEEQDQVEDYLFTRTISRRLIEKGLGTLELAMVLAKESEHPKAFDTVNNLLTTIGNLNKDLAALHKKPGPQKQKAAVIYNTQNNIMTPDNDPKSIHTMLDGLGASDAVVVKDADNG